MRSGFVFVGFIGGGVGVTACWFGFSGVLFASTSISTEYTEYTTHRSFLQGDFAFGT